VKAPKQTALQTPTTSMGSPSQTQGKPIVVASENGKETFSTNAVPLVSKPALGPKMIAPSPTPMIEDEDDLDIPIQPGTRCLRQGCGKEFLSQEESRLGDGEHSVCTYHSSPPVFHEGSKGYMCCKRRVLDFDDFLKIQGCKTGKHVFAKKARTAAKGQESDEFVKCRIDHYQTPEKVHVSVYAKKADKEKSKIVFNDDQIHLDLYLPQSKRFQHTLILYDRINPGTSSFTFFGTKVDLQLDKAVVTSWSFLERPSEATVANLPNGYGLTFGVSGRTGTIGAKTAVLDSDNKFKADVM